MTALVPVQGQFEPETKPLTIRVDEYLALADWVLETDEDLQLAVDAMNDIRHIEKGLETVEKTATAPMADALAVVRGWFRGYRARASEARELMNRKIRVYTTLRTERIAAAEMALAEALKTQDAPAAAQAIVVLTPAPKVQGLVLVDTWDFEETNHSIVPTSLTELSAPKVRAEIKRQVDAGVAAPAIPGCRVFRKQIVKGTGR